MKFLIEPFMGSDEYKNLLTHIKNGNSVKIDGTSDAQKAHLSFAICEMLNKKGVMIASTEVGARKLYDDLKFFYKDRVLFYPTDELVLFDYEAMSRDALFERLKVMKRLISNDFSFVVMSINALSRKLMPMPEFSKNIVRIDNDSKIDISKFINDLIILGYERVDFIESKGHFTVRGGIIDIYPVNLSTPVRVELFDDEVDSLRMLDMETQRSLEIVGNFEIYPVREIVLNQSERDNAIRLLDDLVNNTSNSPKKDGVSDKSREKVKEDIQKFKDNYYFSGMERYIPFYLDNSQSILDYIVRDSLLFIDDVAKVEQSLHTMATEHEEVCKNLIERGSLISESVGCVFLDHEVEKNLEKYISVSYSSLQNAKNIMIKSKQFKIQSKSTPSYSGKVDMMINDIRYLKQSGYKIVILSGAESKSKRFAEALKNEDLEVIYFESYDFETSHNFVSITHGSLSQGVEYPDFKFCVFSEREIFGEDTSKKKRFMSKARKGKKIEAFTDLKPGDYIVHYSHGIGQYIGVDQLVVDKIIKDYIKIRYRGKDTLYLPIDQMDLIQKYIGSEGKSPKLNKLGGADWSKTREKVKESLKELAGELIRLYAEREATKGFAFSKDTTWQLQMEEAFPYQETDDQLKCIEEIKKDLEAQRPMDRLLCGDVGFGKTEVAMRAVFKAVMDGKQVAYLVPTTVLAQQQYHSFKTRMQDFPVNIDVLSRFKTKNEQSKTLKEIKAGNIDVLIGTHRLLQKDIAFKDLGLLVVDEEQRFGVVHKERIKTMYSNIDVLTLSATPIPRTLHMSLVGIRDISIIEEPPQDRHPVETYVMEHDPEMIRSAITRELGRKGQIFYLYNNVRGIDIKAMEVAKLVPEARVAVAHGQMGEGKLEHIMQSFLEHEYDVLVCSTIIESGLDIPNVNTIIVEESDHLGLAQLYQIRGRVGRSNRIAYAYLTFKRDKVLSEIAAKRLQAIKEFTELGSGFKIAMRDLEIRGAGNLLGSQQHGHMDSVGYDMYVKLLEEAVRDMKGEEPLSSPSIEVNLDLKVNAYIDAEYIPSELVKMEIYKKISIVENDEDVLDIQDELVDRFGDVPDSVANLINVAYIKSLASKCGIVSIVQKDNSTILYPVTAGIITSEIISELSGVLPKKIFFTIAGKPHLTIRNEDTESKTILSNIKILLQNMQKNLVKEKNVYN